MTASVDVKKIAIFEVIATGLCGLGALYIYKNKISFNSAVGVGILTASMYAPSISVFITQKLIYGENCGFVNELKTIRYQIMGNTCIIEYISDSSVCVYV